MHKPTINISHHFYFLIYFAWKFEILSQFLAIFAIYPGVQLGPGEYVLFKWPRIENKVTTQPSPSAFVRGLLLSTS